MKEFFYARGEQQCGPFSLEELKREKISKETLVWAEGLEDWTEAVKIDELKSIFHKVPPPLKKKVKSSTLANESKVVSVEKKNSKKSLAGLAIGVITIGMLLIAVLFFKDEIFISRSSSSISTAKPGSYEEQLKSIQEIEKASPAKYLTSSGTYQKNLIGDKVVISGKITNSATKVVFKDPVIKVRFYSKTETLLGTKNYTIYQVIQPGRTISFKLRVPNYKDVSLIGWNIVSAKAK